MEGEEPQRPIPVSQTAKDILRRMGKPQAKTLLQRVLEDED